MDDLSCTCAIGVFEHLDVEIDIDNEEDFSVHYNSDCISDSDCDEIEE